MCIETIHSDRFSFVMLFMVFDGLFDISSRFWLVL